MLIKKINSINLLPYVTYFLVATIGFLGGMIIYKNLIYKSEVLYISQDEIIDCEKSRIEELKSNINKTDNILQVEGELFYGNTKEALELVKSLSKEFEENGNVVVLSEGKIYGKNVRSISTLVHSKIISKIKSNIRSK